MVHMFALTEFGRFFGIRRQVRTSLQTVSSGRRSSSKVQENPQTLIPFGITF
jgi:hypothetical protein